MKSLYWLVAVPLCLVSYRDLLHVGTIHSMANGLEEWFFSPFESSPFMVLGVSAWLLYRRRNRLKASPPSIASKLFSSLFLVLAATLLAWAYYVGVFGLLSISLCFAILGLGILFGGMSNFAALLTPAFFLLFLAPRPGVLINRVVFFMQIESARLASALLHLIGVPAERVGDLIFANGHVFQVIESCSGIRSLETLTMAAVVFSELFVRRRSRALCIIGAAPFIAFFMNGIRILLIIVSPFGSVANTHTTQGILMIIVGTLTLELLDRILRLWLPCTGRRSGTSQSRQPSMPSSRQMHRVNSARHLVSCGILVVVCTLTFVTPRWQPPTESTWDSQRFSRNLGNWSSPGFGSVDKTFLGSVGFSNRIFREYTSKNSPTMNLFIGVDNRLNPMQSVISKKVELMKSGSTIVESVAIEVKENNRPATQMLVREPTGDQLVIFWYEGTGSFTLEVARAFFGLDRSPFRRHEPAIAVRISAPLDRSNPDRLEQDLVRFTSIVQALIPDHGQHGSIK